jgi:tetratricopeptide (TPR) repeat protein
MKRHARGAVAALLSSTLLAGSLAAHESKPKTELFRPGAEHAGTEPATVGAQPPLVQGMGQFGLVIDTDAPLARSYFEQGLGYLWGFNHAEAARSFRAAQTYDPACAMCYWGEAYALGPNLNDIMHPENGARAWQAALLAAQRATSDLEVSLTHALLLRYTPYVAGGDRNVAFAERMQAVAATFPDDANVQALAADAMMNAQPWDYWEAGGVAPKGFGADILATLERALVLSPDHPAALHLYIHASEASSDPGRAEDAADRLAALELSAGHLVHMPAHIYNRVGRFADSIAVNKAAIAADEAFLASTGDAASPLYRFGYYPHNVHFLLVGAQMAGVADEALAAADKLAAITSDEVSAQIAWVQAIRTAPFTAQVQFSDPRTILALADPGDAMPFVQAHWHYARGIALARSGAFDAARDEVEAIATIIETADLSGLEAQYLPAKTVLGIARLVVEARIEQARGNWEAAIGHLEAAIALEAEIAYMEPPYWYYPVRQTLGAVLLQAGDADGAGEAFAAALEQTPNNGWALWGLTQARPSDFAASSRFEKAWLGDTALLTLDRL